MGGSSARTVTSTDQQQCYGCTPPPGQTRGSQAHPKESYTSRYDIEPVLTDSLDPTVPGQKLFLDPSDGELGKWGSNKWNSLGLTYENPEEYEIRVQEIKDHLAKTGWSLAELTLIRHEEGPHNLRSKVFPDLAKDGLHNIESPRDCLITEKGRTRAGESAQLLSGIFKKETSMSDGTTRRIMRMPAGDSIYSSPSSRVILTVKEEWGPLVPDWKLKVTRDLAEQRHSHPCDAGPSKTSLEVEFPDRVIPADDMTEHDEKWRCIACSIASAPESAPTHENAAEVKTRINSMELLQRNLTVSPLTRVTEPSTWRESESDMIHRIRRGLESVLDDQAHLSSLDPSNDHRIGLAGHSRQGSILMQKILGLYPGLSQAKSKLQHGETRKLLFKYRLQDGLTPLPSTWSKASQNGLQSKSTERAVLRTLDSNTLRDQ